MTQAVKLLTSCYCTSGKPYCLCCEPLHLGVASPAPTPESLMRSRYSAYVLGLSPYLLSSWAAQTRPCGPILFDPQVKWLGLKILAASVAPDRRSGTVEFVARSRLAGKGQRLHEISQFERVENQWCYVTGDIKTR